MDKIETVLIFFIIFKAVRLLAVLFSGLICLCYLCFQGIVPTIRREDGGIMPVLIPI